MDWSVGAYHQANDRVRQSTIALLQCPSGWYDEYPGSSYAGVHHDTEAPIDTINAEMFVLNQKLRAEDVVDGPSYTLLLGEKLMDSGSDLGWITGTPATLRNTGTPINQPFVPTATDGYDESEPVEEQAAEDFGGYGDFGGGCGYGRAVPWYQPYGIEQYDVYGDPMEETETKEDKPRQVDPYITTGGDPNFPLVVGGFGSPHPGTAQFAFADGSVRILNEDIDTKVFSQLANRSDGALIDQSY